MKFLFVGIAISCLANVSFAASSSTVQETKNVGYNTCDVDLDLCVWPDLSPGLLFATGGSLDDYRATVNETCTKSATIRQCIANVSLTAERCLSEAGRTLLKINRDFKLSGVAPVCVDNGERSAVILGGELQYLQTEDYWATLACMTEAASWMSDATRSQTETLAEVTKERFVDVRDTKECALGIAQDASDIPSLVEFLDEMLVKMKCVSEKDEEVLCTEIIQ